MRDPARIKQILIELEEYWTANPDLRLCQIVFNLAYSEDANEDIFYVEDSKMLTALIDRNVHTPSVIKGSKPTINTQEPLFEHTVIPIDFDDNSDMAYHCVKCGAEASELEGFTPKCEGK